jgi:hypothetical protein
MITPAASKDVIVKILGLPSSTALIRGGERVDKSMA